MGITMDVKSYGFDAEPSLERLAAGDLVSLTPFSAVLKDCQVAVERSADLLQPGYQAIVHLTLRDDAAISGSPGRGHSAEEAVRGAFEEAQRLLRRVAEPSTPRYGRRWP